MAIDAAYADNSVTGGSTGMYCALEACIVLPNAPSLWYGPTVPGPLTGWEHTEVYLLLTLKREQPDFYAQATRLGFWMTYG